MKRRIVWIDTVLVQQWMTQGTRINAECTEGLPPDARFITLGYEARRDRYWMVFESDSWEPAPVGGELPWFDITYTTFHEAPQ